MVLQHRGGGLMGLPLPLSTRQTIVLEDILSRIDLSKGEEALMLPVLTRLRQNLEYLKHRPMNTLDDYYERKA